MIKWMRSTALLGEHQSSKSLKILKQVKKRTLKRQVLRCPKFATRVPLGASTSSLTMPSCTQARPFHGGYSPDIPGTEGCNHIFWFLYVPVCCMLQIFEQGLFWNSFAAIQGCVTDSCSLAHLFFINTKQFPVSISDEKMKQMTLVHVNNPKLCCINLLVIYSNFIHTLNDLQLWS